MLYRYWVKKHESEITAIYRLEIDIPVPDASREGGFSYLAYGHGYAWVGAKQGWVATETPLKEVVLGGQWIDEITAAEARQLLPEEAFIGAEDPQPQAPRPWVPPLVPPRKPRVYTRPRHEAWDDYGFIPRYRWFMNRFVSEGCNDWSLYRMDTANDAAAAHWDSEESVWRPMDPRIDGKTLAEWVGLGLRELSESEVIALLDSLALPKKRPQSE